MDIEIEHPKLDMLYAGAGFVLLAVMSIYILKAVITKNVPAKFDMQIPFSAQAPTDNWSRNEDCEETSITMANAFLTGNFQRQLPAAAAQQAINDLKKWEGLNLGYNANTGADATTRMAEGAFGLQVNQLRNFTESDLKTALAGNHPVLLPINAKLLGNTKYLNGGPLYHMIVLRGYSGDVFTVNDPGTDGGIGNEYTFGVLKNAAANWDPITKSMVADEKIALVVSK